MDDEELARLRERHVLTIDQVRDGGTDEYCKECEQDWPCPVAALLDEVERLRAVVAGLQLVLVAAADALEGGDGDN